MSYEQHMKHSRNHRKDRFVQQCSGYGGSGVSHQMTDEQFKNAGLISFQRVVNESQGMEFPIYVAESGGFWHMVTSAHLFATEIDSFEALLDFGVDMVDGFSKEEFLPRSVDERLVDAELRSEASQGQGDWAKRQGKEHPEGTFVSQSAKVVTEATI